MSLAAASPPRRGGGAWTLGVAAFAIGVVGAACGIGGGLFAVPFLHYVKGLELKRAVATALVLVLATSLSATVAEAARAEPELHASVAWRVALGALVGAQAGYLASRRISARGLRAAFVVVLAAAAARILLGGSSAAEGVDAEQWIGARAHAVALCAGLGGGFLSPLLGIGGGLLMVPALYLGIPGIGFGEARATSLAAGSVAAVRAVWLYARAGGIERGAVVPLALGALGGAQLGVHLVHQEGAVDVARVVLALVLLFVASRFLRDALRPAAKVPA